MRRVRIVGSAVSVLIVAGACATAPAGMQSGAQLEETSPRVESQALDAGQRDSLLAQTYADRQGPQVWINADAASMSGSRQVRANFHVDDDAYVIVGHIDADGVLRIAFPTEPGDDGFVKGNKTYSTNEFFAGFNDQYRMKAQDRALIRGPGPELDSYDGGLGYVFVVASWRPMRVDQFSTKGEWDSFALADEDYLRDPRPAINELASVLAGGNREAYTVQFARYYSTTVSTAAVADQFFDSGYCSGFNSLGYATSQYGFGTGLFNALDYGDSFYGNGGCGGGGYGGYYSGYGLGFSNGAIQGIVVAPPRTYAFNGHHPQPQPVGKIHFPSSGQTGVQNASSSTPKHDGFSPDYRRRGLITTDDGTQQAGPERRSARAQARMANAEQTRPSIQQMISGRSDDANSATAGSRYRDRSTSGSNADGRSRERRSDDGQSRPSTADHPQSAPRSEQQPRAATPRSSPPPAPVQRSAPASSSGSSTSRTPQHQH